MVIRKTSIPMPTSLPPPPPAQSVSSNADASSMLQRSSAGTTSQYEEMGNPWQEESIYVPPTDRVEKKREHDIPHLLRPGGSRSPLRPTTQPTTNVRDTPVPDILRPGWSGEVTPRSSIDGGDREADHDGDQSPEREWWDDDADDGEKGKSKDVSAPGQLHVVNDVPSASATTAVVKRKPVPPNLTPQKDVSPSTSFGKQSELSSNNPFRRPSDANPHDSPWLAHDQPREDHPHPLRSSPSTDRLGQLAFTRNDPMSMSEKEVWSQPLVPDVAAPSVPPPPVPQIQEPVNSADAWSSQSVIPPIPSPTPSAFEPAKQHQTVPTDHLLDRGHHDGSVSLRDELKAIPNHATAPSQSSTSELLLLHDDTQPPTRPAHPSRFESDDMYAPPTGPPPSHQARSQSEMPPPKPPRPAVVTSDADLARLQGQRNETYQIKHFNWYDMRTAKMRRSSMLTQNKNGPCPLLALVNALILGATEDMQAALDETLRLREQVSLGLIIETLMDELVTRAAKSANLQLPEIEELNGFLMRLRTGMNANPRFVPLSQPAPNLMDADTPTTPTNPTANPTTPAGTFEHTQDIALYSSFKVKLVHGWLPQPGDQAATAFSRAAQTYEDAQAVMFGEEELEYKLSSGGLTDHEQQLWGDISSIKQFFQNYPTQLTPYGLGAVQKTLQGGEFAILFRNDHFSTIYKHPRDQKLYTLITDAGYAERDEIIWETLADITGAGSEFFSGDFHSVSHGDSSHPIPHSMTDAANPQRQRAGNLSPQESFHTPQALTSQEQQEQADMDFALALQMQEEEEQAQRQSRAQQQNENSSRTDNRPYPPPRSDQSQGRRPGQGIPIPLRGNAGNENRPSIPPRNRNPAVNRPADAESADAPPTYEVAARQTAYVPPLGSPLHTGNSNDFPMGRTSTSTSNIHAQGQTTGVTGNRMPNSTAGGNPGQQWNTHSPDYSAGVYAPAYAFMSPSGDPSRQRALDANGRERDRDRDCIVM